MLASSPNVVIFANSKKSDKIINVVKSTKASKGSRFLVQGATRGKAAPIAIGKVEKELNNDEIKSLLCGKAYQDCCSKGDCFANLFLMPTSELLALKTNAYDYFRLCRNVTRNKTKVEKELFLYAKFKESI